MRKITRILLAKSTDSFLLALELFNKPTINYRSESFAIFFTNAWELLMKAYLYENSSGKKTSIFLKKKRNQKRETITLDQCLTRLFANEKDYVRRNIEYVSEVRNSASHLYISTLDPYLARVYQSGAINFLNQAKMWFGKDLQASVKPGLLALISVEQVPDISKLKSQLNKEDFDRFSFFVDKYKELEKGGITGAIPMNYRIALVKNPSKADFVIGVTKDSSEMGIIIERTKDIDQTHPYTTKKTVTEIQTRIPKDVLFTQYSLQSYCFVYGVKKTDKNDCYWKSKNSTTGTYSQKLVDDIVSAINSNSSNLDKWKKSYRTHLRTKRRQSH